MRTITYHLVTALTVFAAGMGQTQVVRAGRIVGVRLTWVAIAGAGGTFLGYASAMLNQNSVVDALTNNPPRETYLSSAYVQCAANSVGSSGPGPYVPVNVPVQPGDLLTMNAGNGGGAAPASSYLACDIYVVES